MDFSLILYCIMAALGFGAVITIHEFGHYLFARWAGVRVEVFSIGFGPIIWKRRVGETDWAISAVPFGGYVKMTGQEDVPSGTEQDAADSRSYLAKSWWWKTLILLGGVLFNLLSAWLIIIGLLAFHGLPMFRPVVGDVEAVVRDHAGEIVASPAARLGLRPGDRILAMNGEQVRAFDDIVTQTMFAGHDPVTVEIERDGRRLTLPPEGAAPVTPVYDRNFGRPSLGIGFPHSNRIVEVGGDDRGLRKGDRVLAIDGLPVADLTGQRIAQLLLASAGREVALSIERGEERIESRITYAGPDGGWDTAIGLPATATAVSRGGPAERAGVRPGDVVASVGGVPVAGNHAFLGRVRTLIEAGKPVPLTIVRDGAELTVTVEPADDGIDRRIGVGVSGVRVGVLGHLPDGPLARAGVRPGDALLASKPDGERRLVLTVLPGATRIVLPVPADEAAWKAALKPRVAGTFGRIVGDKGDPAAIEQLIGAQVVALLGADRKPVGSPAPGQVTLRRHDGATAVVDLAIFGAGREALLAGLQEGDWITGLADQPDGGRALELVRGATAPPRQVALEVPVIGTALRFAMEEIPYHPKSVGESAGIIWDTSTNMVVKTLQLFPRFFRKAEDGGIDPNRALSGPVGIFRELKARFELWGLDSYLKMLALVSLNLFLVNLLPIPITDGGQLVIVWIEAAIRRPLPLLLRNALMYAGFALVVVLFIYVTGLDVLRWVGLM